MKCQKCDSKIQRGSLLCNSMACYQLQEKCYITNCTVERYRGFLCKHHRQKYHDFSESLDNFMTYIGSD